MNDESKVVVVTGANRGIGLAIAKALCKEGYSVAACSRLPSDALEKTLSSSVCEGAEFKLFRLDLLDKDCIKETAGQIGGWKGSVGALVNCAGVAQGSLFSMTRLEDLQKVFEVNYFSQMFFTQLLVKKMIRAKVGAIVNIASTAGILADPGTLAYGGSKAALIHSTRVMAAELGAFGIRVNAIAPSVVETEMAGLMDEKARVRLDARSAIPGAIAPDEIANLVSFLVSERATKITGQVIRIDRGMPF